MKGGQAASSFCSIWHQLGGTEKLSKMVSEITEALRQPELLKAAEKVQLEMQLCQRARLEPRGAGSTCSAVEGALQDGH